MQAFNLEISTRRLLISPKKIVGKRSVDNNRIPERDAIRKISPIRGELKEVHPLLHTAPPSYLIYRNWHAASRTFLSPLLFGIKRSSARFIPNPHLHRPGSPEIFKSFVGLAGAKNRVTPGALFPFEFEVWPGRVTTESLCDLCTATPRTVDRSGF